MVFWTAVAGSLLAALAVGLLLVSTLNGHKENAAQHKELGEGIRGVGAEVHAAREESNARIDSFESAVDAAREESNARIGSFESAVDAAREESNARIGAIAETLNQVARQIVPRDETPRSEGP